MAETILEAISIGSFNSWSLGAGASKTAAVNLPDDDGTSYILRVDSAGRQSFDVEKLENASIINSVTATARHSLDAIGTPGNNEGISAGVYTGAAATEESIHLSTSTWAYRTDTTGDLARPGGGSWALTDFPGGGAGTQASVLADIDQAGSDLRVTTLYLTVDHEVAASGFISLVSGLLPFVGANLTMLDALAMLKATEATRRTRLTAAELPRLLRALRAYKFPSYSMLRAA